MSRDQAFNPCNPMRTISRTRVGGTASLLRTGSPECDSSSVVFISHYAATPNDFTARFNEHGDATHVGKQ
jgi:hypothetical protein